MAVSLRSWAADFRDGNVSEQRLAASLGQRIEGLRPARDETLLDRDVAGVLELAQMDAGIAVGRLRRGAHGREIGGSGGGEESDEREAGAAGHAFGQLPAVRNG